jgi:hypothetical protein
MVKHCEERKNFQKAIMDFVVVIGCCIFVGVERLFVVF